MNIWLKNIFYKNYCAVFYKKIQLLCYFFISFPLVSGTSVWIKSFNIPIYYSGWTWNHLLELHIGDRPKINLLKPDFLCKVNTKHFLVITQWHLDPQVLLISGKPKLYMVEYLVFLTSGLYLKNYHHFLCWLMISIMIIISNGNVLMATFRAALSLVLLLSKSGIPFRSNHCKRTRQVKTPWISIKYQ